MKVCIIANMEKFDHGSVEDHKVYLGEMKVYDEEADMWLAEQMKRVPVFRKGKVRVDQANLVLYEGVLSGLEQLSDSNDNFTWREDLKLDCYKRRLAKMLDSAQSVLDQGKKKYNDDEFTAHGFGRQFEVNEYAKRGVERGQKLAIEAGLSGIDLGKDFKDALNQLWDISVGFGVSDNSNEEE